MGNILCCMDDKKYPYGDRDGYHETDSTNDPFKTINFHNQQSNENDNEDPKKCERQFGQEDIRQSHTDHLSDYEFDGDSDTELEEFATNRNDDEEHIQFSKNGFKQMIDQFIDLENSEDQFKNWDLKLDKDDVRIFIKKGGSSRNQEQPFIKASIIFNAKFSMKKIIESIFSLKHRTAWDKNVLKLEAIPMSHKNCFYNYQVNKGILNMNNRDFVDKQIKFASDGKLYVYYSGIPNDTNYKPVPNRSDRAQTIIGMQRMERLPDGRIMYQTFIQGDLKIKITPKLIAMFLPSGIQDWVKRCNKYITDNYDRI